MAGTASHKVLSVRQPWAWLLVCGYKDIENRNWKTDFRGRCLIHAGQRFDQEGYEWVRQNFKQIPMPRPADFERGGIVGWVEITDCVTASTSKWFFGRYGFVIGSAGTLPFVPAQGSLGIFSLQFPILVAVSVDPNRLIVNSGARAQVLVQVQDSLGFPVADLGLSGTTRPKSLGKVLSFLKTDARGRSDGTWEAGYRTGKGLLIVTTAGGDEGAAEIELVTPPKPPEPPEPSKRPKRRKPKKKKKKEKKVSPPTQRPKGGGKVEPPEPPEPPEGPDIKLPEPPEPQEPPRPQKKQKKKKPPRKEPPKKPRTPRGARPPQQDDSLDWPFSGEDGGGGSNGGGGSGKKGRHSISPGHKGTGTGG